MPMKREWPRMTHKVLITLIPLMAEMLPEDLRVLMIFLPFSSTEKLSMIPLPGTRHGDKELKITNK